MIEKDLRKFIEAITDAHKTMYGIDNKEKPDTIHEFLEQRKDKQPFYKDHKKKPWE